MKNRRQDWVVLLVCVAIALSGCGGGCGGCGMQPIPGGFPVEKRTPNAAQVRVTPTALARITADPAAIIGPLVGNATRKDGMYQPSAFCSLVRARQEQA